MAQYIINHYLHAGNHNYSPECLKEEHYIFCNTNKVIEILENLQSNQKNFKSLNFYVALLQHKVTLSHLN